MVFGRERSVLFLRRLHVAVIAVTGIDAHVVSEGEQLAGDAADDLPQVFRRSRLAGPAWKQSVARE